MAQVEQTHSKAAQYSNLFATPLGAVPGYRSEADAMAVAESAAKIHTRNTCKTPADTPQFGGIAVKDERSGLFIPRLLDLKGKGESYSVVVKDGKPAGFVVRLQVDPKWWKAGYPYVFTLDNRLINAPEKTRKWVDNSARESEQRKRAGSK